MLNKGGLNQKKKKILIIKRVPANTEMPSGNSRIKNESSKKKRHRALILDRSQFIFHREVHKFKGKRISSKQQSHQEPN